MKRRDVHEAWETEGRLSGRKHHAALQSCSADLHPKAGWPNSCRSSQPQHAGDATAVASTPHVALHVRHTVSSGTLGLYVLIVRLVCMTILSGYVLPKRDAVRILRVLRRERGRRSSSKPGPHHSCSATIADMLLWHGVCVPKQAVKER